MNISNQDIFVGGGFIATIVAAFTTVKVGLYNKMSYGKHADICSGVQKEVYDKIDKNHTETMSYLMKIMEALGELKGRK
jgi:hypothetical protein